MAAIPNVIQTFYLDSEAVGGYQEGYITAVDIFFKSKPSVVKNVSGSTSPGVTMYLCNVTNDVPDYEDRISGYVRKEYDQIYSMADASVASTFSFDMPAVIPANRFYGICLVFDDEQYSVWTNTQDEYFIDSDQKSTGPANLVNGRFYQQAGDKKSIKYLSAVAATFNIKAAKFAVNSVSVELANRDYEFFNLSNISGYFMGGETVFPVLTPSTGTISISSSSKEIVGLGTDFTGLADFSDIIIKSGSDYYATRIDYVTNATSLTLSEIINVNNSAAQFYPAATAEVFMYDAINKKMTLKNSTANSTHRFTTGSVIRGEISTATANLDSYFYTYVNKIEPDVDSNMNQISSVKLYGCFSREENFANIAAPNTYIQLKNDTLNDLSNSYVIASRSLEVTKANNLINGSSLNIRADITVANTGPIYSFPYIDVPTTDVFVYSNQLTSTTVANGLDTEVTNSGTAKNRYISTKVSFANNRVAEDVVVYATAYRPQGSNIQVYAKVHNSGLDSEAFEDKSWTPLQITENANRYSAGKDDLVEYTFSIPLYPESVGTLPGSFTTVSGNTVVTASGFTPSSNTWSASQLIRIYDPLFPDNYSVHKIQSANSTAFVLDTPASYNGSGMKIDVAKYDRTAFVNKNNDYLLRYYTEGGAAVDKFDTMQIKIVLVSDSFAITPEVESIHTIATSA